MKSIIQVLPALNQGGVERGTIEIATALKQAGIPNYVISSGGKMVSELEAIGVEHITLPVASKNPIKILLNARKMAKIFKEKKKKIKDIIVLILALIVLVIVGIVAYNVFSNYLLPNQNIIDSNTINRNINSSNVIDNSKDIVSYSCNYMY